MRSGWIKFPRMALENPVITKDADHLALWVYLVCNAAYEETPALLGGKPILLQPGQFTTGRKQLSVNSGIEENKVERILKAFASAQLIKQQTTSKNRLISIVSWVCEYESEQQSEQQVNNERTTSEQQVNTLEENKKLRNKEIKSIEGAKPPRTRFIPPSLEEVAAYCRERRNAVDPQRFVDHYTANGWMVGKTKMKNWEAAVRKWESGDSNRISSSNTKTTSRDANALFGLVPDVCE